MGHRRYCRTISSSPTSLWRSARIGRKGIKTELIPVFRYLPVPVSRYPVGSRLKALTHGQPGVPHVSKCCGGRCRNT